MPKAPILSREAFFGRLRDGSFRHLDWCLVNTSLGAMVEPRQLRVEGSKFNNRDVYDGSFTSIREFNEDQMPSLMGTGGQQVPVDFVI